MASRSTIQRLRYRELGICIQCGSEPARDGLTTCDGCAEKQKAASFRYQRTEKGKAAIYRQRTKPSNAARWADSLADYIDRIESGSEEA